MKTLALIAFVLCGCGRAKPEPPLYWLSRTTELPDGTTTTLTYSGPKPPNEVLVPPE